LPQDAVTSLDPQRFVQQRHRDGGDDARDHHRYIVLGAPDPFLDLGPAGLDPRNNVLHRRHMIISSLRSVAGVA
jgi:hypothetical protein